MSGILDDLSAYVDTGVNGNMADVDLNECLQLARYSTPRVQLLVVNATPLPVVLGHKSHLVRLFQNLLDNAIKYAGDDVRVTVTAEQAGSCWTIRFSDDGPGIPAGQLERVFRPMKRLHGWWEVPGSGLGLAACRRVVQLHGGEMYAVEVPVGACFEFTLPME
jgi:signal transduction histidine kinase